MNTILERTIVVIGCLALGLLAGQLHFPGTKQKAAPRPASDFSPRTDVAGWNVPDFWSEGRGDVLLRRAIDGALLYGQMQSASDLQSFDSSNPPCPASIERFARSGKYAGWMMGEPEDWKASKEPAARVHALWHDAETPFSIDAGEGKLLFKTATVSGPARWAVLVAPTPDGAHVAVVFASGERRQMRAASGPVVGRGSEYDGPFFVQAFAIQSGLPAGHAVRLWASKAGPVPLGNWSADGLDFACFAQPFGDVWFVSREELGIPHAPSALPRTDH